MREIFDKFVPLRGRFSADLSLLEGNNRPFCPSLRDFSYLCIINQTSTSYDRNETL